MRPTLLTAAIAAVILPVAAAPISDEITSGHIRLPMDSLRLFALDPFERKSLNHIESLPRHENETHVKNVYPTSLTGAPVGAASHAIVAHAAVAGRSIKRDRIDDASGSKAYHDAYQHYQQEADRGASDDSTIAAASDHPPTLPEDAELDALAALVQAPSPTFDVHIGDTELHNVGEIVGAMDNGKSIDEIHQAFHNKDGEPVYLTDEEIDSAVAGYSIDVISDLGQPLGPLG